MAKHNRPKYKPKNPNEYKRIYGCTCHEGCLDDGIIVYRNPDKENDTTPVKYEHRCIEHIHVEKEPDVITEAKNPSSTNIYTVMIDHKPWMDMSLYATGKGR